MLVVLVILFVVGGADIQGKPWMSLKDTPAQRAQKLLSQMNQDEKLDMVHGHVGTYVGNVPSNKQLGIPALNLEDGPQGVADKQKKVTCFPSGLTVAATWDVDLMYQYGQVLAEEQRTKGTNVMLGPENNLDRVPQGGRNFESFGEDPYLAASLVESSVKGIQSRGVIACSKHFVNNNQEQDRREVSANVDERTEFEMYYPAFEAAVRAGVGSIMCSYNKINDTYACENDVTLNRHLKQTMQFQGWVMSDWGATHSTEKAANSGLDQEMPSGTHFGAALKKAIQDGSVPQSRLDNMVLRILTPMFAVGLFDTPQPYGNLSADARSPEHSKSARDLAAAATVLVKNSQNALPLDPGSGKVAVLGADAHDNCIYAGTGSGHVNIDAGDLVTPLDAIKKRVTGEVSVTYYGGADLDQAKKVAQAADVALVFVGTTSGENSDRKDLSLGSAQDNLITSVASAQPNTVVVVHCPGAVHMPWHGKVPAIVVAFLPGEEDGNAIADILFGDVNPSGRLPVTFPQNGSQTCVSTPQQYPGVNKEAAYSEKLLVGYRWYDQKDSPPLYPFGHGLSYTTFQYADLKIEGTGTDANVTVSLNVQNTGKIPGYEVVQLYLGFPASAGEPPKVLKGFKKVLVEQGMSSEVSLVLPPQSRQIWDVPTHSWKSVSGDFQVLVGSSAGNILLKGKFTN